MTYDSRAYDGGGATYRGGGGASDRKIFYHEAPQRGGLYDVSDRAPRQYDAEDEPTSSTTPRIPLVRRAESGKENEDGLLSPRRFSQQVDAFGEMCNAGADWGSAFVAALQGHKMTEEQAAICLQSHWRRHEAAVSGVARNLAAEHIQYAWRERTWLREGAAAALQAGMRGARERVFAQEKLARHRAASRIGSVWRGKLARARYAALLKKKRGGFIKRSLSFTSKKKGASKGASPAPATPPPAAADGWDSMHSSRRDAGAVEASGAGGKEGLAKRVRRSLSFDRGGSKSGSSSQPQSVAATRRTFVLERGPNGLGLELDATNTVVTIKPGGRAERQGLLALGDTVLTIDGKSCAGVLMQDVMVPGRAVYVVEISRPERAQYVPPAKSNIIKRSLSFDTKKSGSVRRSFSFERKRP